MSILSFVTFSEFAPRRTAGYHLSVARIAILTASDKGAAGQREDASGDLAQRRVEAEGHTVVHRTVVADDRAAIAAQLRGWCDGGTVDIVLTTGGTGLTARDCTPEATRDIAERDVPGVASALLINGLQKTPFAMVGRGIAVTRASTLVVNLPGAPKAVDEGLDVLLPLFDHISELLAGPVEHGESA